MARPKSPNPVKAHTVSLDDHTVHIGKIIGNGNLSAGVRAAVQYLWKSKQGAKIAATHLQREVDESACMTDEEHAERMAEVRANTLELVAMLEAQQKKPKADER